MKEDEFYLRDTRSNVGSTCMFWKKGGYGYTSNLDQAEIFTHEQAQRYTNEQRHFIPLSKKQSDEVATVRVDMQCLEDAKDMSKGFVIQLNPSEYDGNDIFFLSKNGFSTPNYNEAHVIHSLDELMVLNVSCRAISIHSKAFLDSIARRTLQVENVNHRKMMTAAGIKYRAPRKSRATSGKTRGNCPSCGKITWGYNPHENEYCGSIECRY
jgi:hypothetical protein